MTLKTQVDGAHTIGVLRDLIRINSVNPSLVPGAPGEGEIAEYVADYLRRLGLETTVEEVETGRLNVVGILGEGEPALMLNGHMDTVGADYMTCDPFDPKMIDNKVYGRGAADMKGGLSAILASTKAVVDSGCELEGSLVVAAVCDEEYASIGTEKLMENARVDAAVVGEPTGLDILIAHKGFAWIDIETRGVAAHGSAWREGVDAIAKMGKVQVGLEELMKGELREREHKLLGNPSIHASTISGGRELSTYPDYCKLQVERRLIPGEDERDLDIELSRLLSSIGQLDPDFDGSYEVTFFRGPMEVSRDENICLLLRDCTRNVTGRIPRYIGGAYWLDTQIIWQHGVPVVAFGPTGFGLHAAVEYVEADSVVENARILENLIKRFCGVKE